ncbi:hypothetical protein G7Y89_g12425 [Cudoniella acicularis]|uniref:Uncharacterized protein n=1 Tax=Cudoniella acicularis TaxID=354080 RepID=A0A8H4VZ67_9HELO|nr:hypothetical protein G7Y89_g12425 [Cudoniella acicularis]
MMRILNESNTSSGINSTTQTTNTTSGSGTSIFGSTIYWPFNSSISSPGTTSLNFEDITYPINGEIFIPPAQPTVTRATNEIVIRGAALTSLSCSSSMADVLYVPTSQAGDITNKITNATVEMTTYGTAGNYTLFEGSVTTSQASSIVVKVLLDDAASKTVKSKIFVGGV